MVEDVLISMSVLLQAVTTRVPANAEVIQHVRSGLLVLAHRTPSSVPQGQGKISGEEKKKHEKENAPERKKRKAHDNLSLSLSHDILRCRLRFVMV